MSTAQRRFAMLGVLACALLVWTWSTRFAPRPARSGSFAQRMLGPFATIAAAVQWTRTDLALRRGDWTTAYARAETALDLDPHESTGWIFLAHHFVFERAALSREPDPRARERWIKAGLALLERGGSAAHDRGEVWLYRGAVMAFLASLADADRAWPPTAAEAWRAAAEDFARAAELGHPEAADAADRARALALR